MHNHAQLIEQQSKQLKSCRTELLKHASLRGCYVHVAANCILWSTKEYLKYMYREEACFPLSKARCCHCLQLCVCLQVSTGALDLVWTPSTTSADVALQASSVDLSQPTSAPAQSTSAPTQSSGGSAGLSTGAVVAIAAVAAAVVIVVIIVAAVLLKVSKTKDCWKSIFAQHLLNANRITAQLCSTALENCDSFKPWSPLYCAILFQVRWIAWLSIQELCVSCFLSMQKGKSSGVRFERMDAQGFENPIYSRDGEAVQVN